MLRRGTCAQRLRCGAVLYSVLFCCCLAFPPRVHALSAEKGSEDTPPLEQMMGAMLMLGFHGMALADDAPFARALAAGEVGNVILFDRHAGDGGARNISSPEQLRRLTAELRACAPGPIFIAVDQEGGQVRRLRPEAGFLDLPSAQSMGRGSPAATRGRAEVLGRELASLGIDVNFAPVADVDSNPQNPVIARLGRAFGTDAAQVAVHALAFGQGLARAGVIPVLKHFPGHGCSGTDSHLGMADISQCWVSERDLLPYAEIFQRGWPGMVMVGHLFHDGLDAAAPATLSRAVVTGLLREGLGWQGVVVSDDMQMRAIADEREFAEAMCEAVAAGVDILVYGNNLQWQPDLPQRAHATLRRLVAEGRISPGRIAQSWRRIAALRALYAANADASWSK